jgi:hypothetical protein
MSGLDLTWITETYFRSFEDRNQINDGWCYVWAWLAKLAHPEAQLISFDGGVDGAHAFIQIGDLYFDSSFPCGAVDPVQFAFFNGEPFSSPDDGYLLHQTPQEFKAWWRGAKEFWDLGLPRFPAKLPRRMLKAG